MSNLKNINITEQRYISLINIRFLFKYNNNLNISGYIICNILDYHDLNQRKTFFKHEINAFHDDNIMEMYVILSNTFRPNLSFWFHHPQYQ